MVSLDEGDLETLFLGLMEVEAEFSLCWGHAVDGGELVGLLEVEEGLAVGFRAEVVEDFDAFCCLLEGEVAHVGDEDDELFLVIRAAGGLWRWTLR